MKPRQFATLLVRFTACTLLRSALKAATLEESAKSEGEVVLYSSLNNEQIVTLVDAFKKKYPAIKPSFYRATSERVLQRAITEARAGRFAVDVVTSRRVPGPASERGGPYLEVCAAGSVRLR